MIIKCQHCNQKNRIKDFVEGKTYTCGTCKNVLDVRDVKILNRIKEEINRIRNYTPKVAIYGDTGVGKSSLCNALFGKEIAKISDVEACTRKPQEIIIGKENENGGIRLIDVPGIGEDPARHQEYIELYESLLPKLDLVIWAIKADDRKYASAIEVYEKVLKQNLRKCPVIFVITQVDKIEPYRDWDLNNNRPGIKQKENIVRKIDDIARRFNISKKNIIPVSANDKYNLVELVSKTVELLPNDKKSSFAREAKEENVSEDAYLNAEKGTWDYIKDKFEDVWDSVKEKVVEEIVKNAPKLIEKGVDWLKSKFDWSFS